MRGLAFILLISGLIWQASTTNAKTYQKGFSAIHLVACKQGRLPTDEPDHIFAFDDAIKMYAVIESDGGFYLGDSRHAGLPRQVSIGGRKVATKPWPGKPLDDQIVWKKLVLDAESYRMRYSEFARGWEGPVEITGPNFSLSLDDTERNRNVGTGRFKVQLGGLESKEVSIGRRGGERYPGLPSEAARIINTFKLFQGDSVAERYGATFAESIRRQSVDCANLVLGAAFYLGYISPGIEINASGLAGDASFPFGYGVQAGKNIQIRLTRPATSWPYFYQFRGERNLDLATDGQLLYLLHASDSEDGDDEYAVYKLSPSGQLLSKIKLDGIDPFPLISRMKVYRGLFFVLDTMNRTTNQADKVYVFSSRGARLNSLLMKGPLPSSSEDKSITWDSDPVDIAFDEEGNCYILEQDFSVVRKFRVTPYGEMTPSPFDLTGTNVIFAGRHPDNLPQGPFHPQGRKSIAFWQGKLFVANSAENNDVVILDARSGKHLGTFFVPALVEVATTEHGVIAFYRSQEDYRLCAASISDGLSAEDKIGLNGPIASAPPQAKRGVIVNGRMFALTVSQVGAVEGSGALVPFRMPFNPRIDLYQVKEKEGVPQPLKKVILRYGRGPGQLTPGTLMIFGGSDERKTSFFHTRVLYRDNGDGVFNLDDIAFGSLCDGEKAGSLRYARLADDITAKGALFVLRKFYAQ